MKAQYKKIKSVNEKLTLFLFEQEALIYSDVSNKVHLLNALGIFIWLQLEEGLNQEQVKRTAITNGCENSSELENLIDELSGLFRTGFLDESSQNTDEDQEEWLSKISLVSPLTDTSNELYRILDTGFVFEFPNKTIKSLVEPMLLQFSVAQVSDQEKEQAKLVKLKIIPGVEDKHYQISVNDFMFSWRIPEKRLLSFLLDRLRKIAFYFSDYYLAAHSAVLAKNTHCFMFPAVSYSGKSTLSAALFSSGYRYLSDEMAVLDKDFKARPVPLGLGLKKGSWSVLHKDLPQLADTPELERWDGVAIKYLSIKYLSIQYLPINTSKKEHKAELKGLALSKERVKVSHLVFPRYTPNAQACLQAISIPQALFSLYQAGYAQAYPLSEARLEQMLAHLSAIPAYQFDFDDLGEAINCLERVQ